jgi:sugar-specific transcriptional regulator TrmB
MSSKPGAPTLTDKESSEVLKDVTKVKEYLKKLERAGAEPPKNLKTAIGKLETATKSGKDVDKAADEAYKELKRHADNMKDDCKNIEKQHEAASKTGKESKFQGKGATYTLDPSVVGANVGKSLNDAVKWLAPDDICKRWEKCGK